MLHSAPQCSTVLYSARQCCTVPYSHYLVSAHAAQHRLGNHVLGQRLVGALQQLQGGEAAEEVPRGVMSTRWAERPQQLGQVARDPGLLPWCGRQLKGGKQDVEQCPTPVVLLGTRRHVSAHEKAHT